MIFRGSCYRIAVESVVELEEVAVASSRMSCSDVMGDCKVAWVVEEHGRALNWFVRTRSEAPGHFVGIYTSPTSSTGGFQGLAVI